MFYFLLLFANEASKRQNVLYFPYLIPGSNAVEAQCRRFEVKAGDGKKVLFSADENEIAIGVDKLRVTGNTH